MYFTLSPASKENFYVNEFLPGHPIIIALEAAKRLKWEVENITKDGFSAYGKDSYQRKASEIVFNIFGDQAFIRSRSLRMSFDIYKNFRNIRMFNDQFLDLKYDLKTDELIRRWEDFKNEFVEPAETESVKTAENADNSGNPKTGILSLFIPKTGYWITPMVVNINILLFIIQIISGVNIIAPEGESLLNWGGNLRALSFTGQLWRLLTNCFLHIGVFHLLMNMYALIYIGLLLEPLINSKRFGYAYLVSGILASVTSACWHENTISAGASGAIFGMYGVFVSLLMTNLIDKDLRRGQLTSMLIFIFYNLAYGLKGGIDNAAHIGGLISGLIIGFTFYPLLKNPEAKGRNILINISVVLGMSLLCGFFISKTNNPFGDYNKIIQNFSEYEEKALSIYRLPQSSADEKYLYEIEQNGLPNWIKCRDLIETSGKIEGIPDQLVKRNKLLLRYCDYRIKSYNIMRTSIREKTFAYQATIEQYNQKIELILKKLNGEEIAESELEIKPETFPGFSLQSSGFFVVDGKPVESIDNLKESDIKGINVLTGEAAKSLYGEKARDGAIMITTWAGSKPISLTPQ